MEDSMEVTESETPVSTIEQEEEINSIVSK